MRVSFVSLLAFASLSLSLSPSSVSAAVTIGTGGIQLNLYSDCKCSALTVATCMVQSACSGDYADAQWQFSSLTADDANQQVVGTSYSDPACTNMITATANQANPQKFPYGCFEVAGAGQWATITSCTTPNQHVGGTGTDHPSTPISLVSFPDSTTCVFSSKTQAHYLQMAGECDATSLALVGQTVTTANAWYYSAAGVGVRSSYSDFTCSTTATQTLTHPINQCFTSSSQSYMFQDNAYATPGTTTAVATATTAVPWIASGKGSCSAAIPAASKQVAYTIIGITATVALIIMGIN